MAEEGRYEKSTYFSPENFRNIRKINPSTAKQDAYQILRALYRGLKSEALNENEFSILLISFENAINVNIANYEELVNKNNTSVNKEFLDAWKEVATVFINFKKEIKTYQGA